MSNRVADTVYLSWRNAPGKRRHLVGEFHRQGKKVHFNYLTDRLMSALESGFRPYPSFPNLNVSYPEVLPIISRRLVSSDRSDRIDYLRFWEAHSEGLDDFDLIALTQAWLTNDSFEFLADFNVQDGLVFVTDVAGQTHLSIGKEEVTEGDGLSWEFEPENEYDSEAVALFSPSGVKVGYVKQVHCRAFHKASSKGISVAVTVHRREMNGRLKRLFVKCEFQAGA